MKKSVLAIVLLLSVASQFALLAYASPAEGATSTRSAVESLMRRKAPRLQVDTSCSPVQYAEWQGEMRSAMAKLMRHPAKAAAEPCKVGEARRDGYRIERWVSYPLEDYAVPFYVLIPDGVTAEKPVAAALCIPGFGQTKELLAGERQGNFMLEGDKDSEERQAAMARILARDGMVAVAVDNPSCGELSDNGYFDYLASSRFLLEMGWSYLGLASWQDRVILDWMKGRPEIDSGKIIISGFSLGTEPMMVLGVLDPSIYAFVYNDFMCRTRERALVMTKPDDKGERAFPNSIEHLIPEFLTLFDFPDIVSALAPRAVICTEGGMDRDFRIISRAYEAAGAPDAFTYHHYAKFVEPESRQYLDTLPSGIDRATFFRLANVDPPHHYFKAEHVLPWLRGLGLIKKNGSGEIYSESQSEVPTVGR